MIEVVELETDEVYEVVVGLKLGDSVPLESIVLLSLESLEVAPKLILPMYMFVALPVTQ